MIHGSDFTEYNVDDDVEAALEMLRKSRGMYVPVIIVGEEVIIGFQQDELDGLLS